MSPDRACHQRSHRHVSPRCPRLPICSRSGYAGRQRKAPVEACSFRPASDLALHGTPTHPCRDFLRQRTIGQCNLTDSARVYPPRGGRAMGLIDAPPLQPVASTAPLGGRACPKCRARPTIQSASKSVSGTSTRHSDAQAAASCTMRRCKPIL
jgi:hypothetical protein